MTQIHVDDLEDYIDGNVFFFVGQGIEAAHIVELLQKEIVYLTGK